MIYLDNSATTKPHVEVVESYRQVSEKFFGNPSSVHNLGIEAERLLNKARQQAATLLGVFDTEIVFTSGGTEGNNTAIKGIALAHQNRGKHIITSQIEHPSVLEACESLESIGFSVTYLPVNRDGVISIDDVKEAITDETILISIMHVNNELGTVQPIEQIADIAELYPKLFFHVDHVQGFGKIPLDLKHNGIDLCTISGHKIHGLKGTGLLYVKKNTKLFPLLHGGGQEMGYRSGTENLAGIVSLVKAIRLSVENINYNREKIASLNKIVRNGIEKVPGTVINTPKDHALHIINFSVPGLKPEVVINALANRNIYISTKSACSSKRPDESAILAACGLDKEIRESGLRVSISYGNIEEEIESFCSILKEIVKQLSEVMG